MVYKIIKKIFWDWISFEKTPQKTCYHLQNSQHLKPTYLYFPSCTSLYTKKKMLIFVDRLDQTQYLNLPLWIVTCSRDSWLEELMGTVWRWVQSSAACAKPGGQLTQHLPCCLCAHSTMSLSLATEYSLRARTPLTTICKSSSQTGPWNSYRHPWSWSWSALFLFPQTGRIIREEVGVSNYHIVPHIGLINLYTIGLCVQNKS